MDYYVSSTGSDSNVGTSAAAAWASVGRAGQAELRPGDRLLFEGGRVFNGTLEIDARSRGDAARGVVIGSYGSGRATIHGGDGDGVRVVSTGGIAIENLNVTGSGRKVNRLGSGVLLLEASNVRVDAVEAGGFQHAGVFFAGCSDVRITNVYAHDNGFAGICAGYGSSRAVSRNAYVGRCR